MGNDIVDGIAIRVGELFPGVEVHRNEIAQGFDASCFFILPLRTTQTAKLGDRYFRRYGFDVHYFPRDGAGADAEIQEVADTLLLGLEYIRVGDQLVRASRTECEVHDGVLHFMVDYDAFILRERENVPYMMTLTQRQKSKG
mgnify:CR=1 FL=1